MKIIRQESNWVIDFDRNRVYNKYTVYDVNNIRHTKVWFENLYEANKYLNAIIENKNKIHTRNSKWDLLWAEAISMPKKEAVEFLVNAMVQKGK